MALGEVAEPEQPPALVAASVSGTRASVSSSHFLDTSADRMTALMTALSTSVGEQVNHLLDAHQASVTETQLQLESMQADYSVLRGDYATLVQQRSQLEKLLADSEDHVESLQVQLATRTAAIAEAQALHQSCGSTMDAALRDLKAAHDAELRREREAWAAERQAMEDGPRGPAQLTLRGHEVRGDAAGGSLHPLSPATRPSSRAWWQPCMPRKTLARPRHHPPLSPLRRTCPAASHLLPCPVVRCWMWQPSVRPRFASLRPSYPMALGCTSPSALPTPPPTPSPAGWTTRLRHQTLAICIWRSSASPNCLHANSFPASFRLVYGTMLSCITHFSARIRLLSIGRFSYRSFMYCTRHGCSRSARHVVALRTPLSVVRVSPH